jgi:hypothetical protein
MLWRSRISTPARSSRAKNPVASADAAAAVVTCRRSVTRGFQFGGMTPAGDDVRVGVLVAPAGTVQVPDERFDALAARRGDLPDHPAIRSGRNVVRPVPDRGRYVFRAARMIRRTIRNVFRMVPGLVRATWRRGAAVVTVSPCWP